MPRSPREDYEDAWHHIMNRGVASQSIFLDDADRTDFLDLLVQATLRHALEIHGYCLMGNHYHLLLRSREGRLSAGMQWFSGRYSQRFNYRHGRKGPIFQGRFTSVHINDSAQLGQTSRYIHLNPVGAGLVSRPEAWPWSSAAAFLGVSSKPDWLRTCDILEMFAALDPTGAYRQFLRNDFDAAAQEFYRRLVLSMGSDPQGLTP